MLVGYRCGLPLCAPAPQAQGSRREHTGFCFSCNVSIIPPADHVCVSRITAPSPCERGALVLVSACLWSARIGESVRAQFQTPLGRSVTDTPNLARLTAPQRTCSSDSSHTHSGTCQVRDSPTLACHSRQVPHHFPTTACHRGCARRRHARAAPDGSPSRCFSCDVRAMGSRCRSMALCRPWDAGPMTRCPRLGRRAPWPTSWTRYVATTDS